MYKDKERQREAVKKAVERHRVLQKGITSEGITGQGITPRLSLVEKLVDPEWRGKLVKIHRSLASFNVDGVVRLGISGPTFDVVGELLDVTKTKQ